MTAPITIDMTPTFKEATAICIAVIENFASTDNPTIELARAKDDATKELLRYAGELDRLKKEGILK